MEKTLEVRWFFPKFPSSAIEHWFELKCPGKLIQKLETREDWYIYPQHDLLKRSLEHLSYSSDPESINLKLRDITSDRKDAAITQSTRAGVLNCISSHLLPPEGDSNLELKLRQQKLGTHQFNRPKFTHYCEGNIEQWCKFSQQELEKFNLEIDVATMTWIGVRKKRKQKIERGVKSELTRLTLASNLLSDREYNWWTIAFEMTQDESGERSPSHFKEVIERTCQTYPEPRLLAVNSYSYSRWLLKHNSTMPS